jgi:type I restriction enzyme R subunit
VTVNERGFEEAIEASLLEAGGYLKSSPSNFDPVVGVDTAELFAFIAATQAREWESLLGRYGNDADSAQRGFARRLASEIDSRGTVDVLRHGVVDLGVTIRLAFFKPAHNLTPELLRLYEANRVTVTRQLPYEAGANKTLDVVLLVNGIPTATAELKNPLTGQNIEHAKKQYREDRDPRSVTLSRRALVHFAVDPESVAMTTKLAGKATAFLPFNLGDNGRAGNPPNPHGHRTSYLWERVWARDAWMDLLARFIHIDRPEGGSIAARRAMESVIFPRYHQWDAVLKLEADAKVSRPGKSYLVQHSAGSGKSNTIAWLAHRLSNLHSVDDEMLFDKVVVITDRVILDRQLQETIYQFEHARGVVVKIDQHSQQLADALAGEQARIIITTLQKFPFVLEKIGSLPQRSYAVIVDEAHSSQTGEAAKDLRMVLRGTDEQELTVAEAEDAGYITEAVDPVEEALAKAVAARGRQANLSFFAFTATPKARTLELFGTKQLDGKYHPFHLYSMRQAIEEGFILDVLRNYTTYQTYWRIEKAILDDPQYESARAKQAIARFVSLHPSNLSQKAEIIVEHFRAHTASKIGGKAKAMVVTSSRLHAVRYKQAIDAHIHRHGYDDVKALVAFSGRVIADDGSWSEASMNGFPESRTAEEFGSSEYQVLVVAEKFQTGFDQPLLHTMYVDKVLTGLNAVQTLSRLNRILPPAKEDTFILDFRNDGDDIVRAFEPYYGQTIAPPTDPNVLYDTHRRIFDYDVIHPDEIQEAVAVLVNMSAKEDHGRIYSRLDPAVGRFHDLHQDDRVAFKDALDRFVRTYSFLSQVVSFGDTKLERDYLYCRALASLLRGANTVERLDLGSQVELTHLRLEAKFSGSLDLGGDTGEVTSFTGDGTRMQHLPDMEPLSQIVDTLNERFGLELTETDQLLFDQYEQDWLADPEVTDQARNNTIENFKLVFDRNFLKTVISRMDENDALFTRILDDPEFQEAIKDFYGRKVYQEARKAQGRSGTGAT